MALSNFDTSMLPRVGYAFLLGLAIMFLSAVLVQIWTVGEHHIRKHCKKGNKKEDGYET